LRGVVGPLLEDEAAQLQRPASRRTTAGRPANHGPYDESNQSGAGQNRFAEGHAVGRVKHLVRVEFGSYRFGFVPSRIYASQIFDILALADLAPRPARPGAA
jgi:hypothetical protein